jgi:hypothetical protein
VLPPQVQTPVAEQLSASVGLQGVQLEPGAPQVVME